MRSLLALFILLPFMEAGLLVVLAGSLGLRTMLLEVIATGVLGMVLLSRTGRTGLLQANQRLRAGDAPVDQILRDMLLGAAGMMLLLPGLATDLVGLSLLVPGIRGRISGQWLRQGDLFRYEAGAGATGRGQRGAGPAAGPEADAEDRVQRGSPPPAGGDVIEGEFRRED